MNVREFEARIKPDPNDPALILPRLEAVTAHQRARKKGDALQILFASARIEELQALDGMDFA